MRCVAGASAVLLAGISALHVVWATGSGFPFADEQSMADTVAGTPRAPRAPETVVVAGLLAAAAALVADVAPVPQGIRRLGVGVVAAVLATRGALGVSGRTAVLVPWTPSDRFVELDRRYYGPLCLALALGAATSVRD
jgi:hypothetical protein